MKTSSDQLILDSYHAHLKNHLPQLAERFYQILWKKHPESKTLFKTSHMELQKQGLAKGIDHIVTNLGTGEPWRHYIDELGIRHGAYGVMPEHYHWVGEALLEALEECYTKKYWSTELADAWTELFSMIAAEMQQGITSVRMTGT